MTTTAELSVLNKIIDLTKRCGVHPLSSEFYLTYSPNEGGPLAGSSYKLSAVGAPFDDAEEQKIEKLWAMLGLDEFGARDFPNLSAIDQIVDQALSHAPRARLR